MLSEQIENQPEHAKQILQASEELKFLGNSKQSLTNYLRHKSRTAKFWIQYLEYIDVLKLFITAERTGDWGMHLSALRLMLNLFAATGHINYAKCARLHLQQMLELETKHPWVHKNFVEHGYHTVRRSDRYWAGLWSDLIIEQVLMRALKTRGGLTRGRGVTESVRLLWVKTMHRSAEVHNAMITLTGHSHRTSEQHVELGASRIRRDNADLQKFLQWFESHDPFVTDDSSLRSLSSGLTDSDTVLNCDEAEDVGSFLQQQLDGVSMQQAKLRRKDQVKTFVSLKPGVTLEQKTVSIDPLILFSRLTAIMQQEGCIAEHFKYELTPEPTSLFKDGLMRKSNKSALRNFLLDQVEAETSHIPCECCVVDGGALLHKVKWLYDSTYEDVCINYVDYVKRRYSRHGAVTVIFDGYFDEMSIKGNEHTRRGSKLASANITINKATTVSSSREVFLKNVDNKVRFIELLTKDLEEAGRCLEERLPDLLFLWKGHPSI